MSVNCVAGETFTFSMRLGDRANAGKWKAAPTIAAGDFQRTINGGAYANLDNLPTVTPAGGVRVQVVLSAAETTAAGAGGLIDVDAIDAAGDEWNDEGAQVRVSARDIDDLAFPNTSGRGMDVDAAGGVEVGAMQTDVVTADALANSAALEISDEVLKRGTSNVEDAADASSLAAQVMATFNSGISGAVWTIRKSDGTTFTVRALTLDPSGKPVIDVS